MAEASGLSTVATADWKPRQSPKQPINPYPVCYIYYVLYSYNNTEVSRNFSSISRWFTGKTFQMVTVLPQIFYPIY